jgi:hypothetical protein
MGLSSLIHGHHGNAVALPDLASSRQVDVAPTLFCGERGRLRATRCPLDSASTARDATSSRRLCGGGGNRARANLAADRRRAQAAALRRSRFRYRGSLTVPNGAAFGRPPSPPRSVGATTSFAARNGRHSHELATDLGSTVGCAPDLPRRCAHIGASLTISNDPRFHAGGSSS